ncbi:hypothetical protein BOW28_07710 [Solemya velum gill symbiont]|uniref:histidine kinase n=1 Tax=Solemya velum gill symbiont TaxID=2340 RepID=UPI000998D949|nr:histidine kinase [Solemya velum gill symbiont]OOZ17076.1 hypothetical protein BOW28_07710 [Solemya velum gill symbiont]OOZ26509.1 hypothetical protein BOW32_07970 [Solemya velum gill symbiont]
MFNSKLIHSLQARLGLAMAAILALAIVSIGSSVIITQTAKGFAAAINQAGTLRMQSYRIVASLVPAAGEEVLSPGVRTRSLVSEFRDRLASDRIQSVMQKNPSLPVQDSYRLLVERWESVLAPLISEYISQALAAEPSRLSPDRLTNLRQAYIAEVDPFVDVIHQFVRALEVEAESKIERLQLIQLIVLILTLVVVVVLLFVRRDLHRPMRELLATAGAVRHGDFSVRCSHPRDDELGQLGAAFNLMAADLSHTYEELEERVARKTADLERSNRSLELFYTVSRRLSVETFDEKVLSQLVDEVGRLIGARGGAICLGQPGDEQAFRLATTALSDLPADDLCIESSDCVRCFGDGNAHMIKPQSENGAYRYSTPVADKGEQYGVLLMDIDEASSLEEWHKRLLDTVAYHISLAIQREQQLSQNRKLALMEERSVIARELHDSLAQTLSYLKIQVSLLRNALPQAGDEKSIEILERLHSGLNSAYGELRELLTTFRLRLGEGGFEAALEQTVEDFRKRGEINLVLENRIGNCRLSPNAEINLVQIIREALSNVVRHSDANEACVSIDCDHEGRVTLLIEDDGVGMPGVEQLEHHHGLAIMRERARGLDGVLDVGRSTHGGTVVKLNFHAMSGQGE